MNSIKEIIDRLVEFNSYLSLRKNGSGESTGFDLHTNPAFRIDAAVIDAIKAHQPEIVEYLREEERRRGEEEERKRIEREEKEAAKKDAAMAKDDIHLAEVVPVSPRILKAQSILSGLASHGIILHTIPHLGALPVVDSSLLPGEMEQGIGGANGDGSSPGICWTARPGDALNPKAAKLICQYQKEIIEILFDRDMAEEEDRLAGKVAGGKSEAGEKSEGGKSEARKSAGQDGPAAGQNRGVSARNEAGAGKDRGESAESTPGAKNAKNGPAGKNAPIGMEIDLSLGLPSVEEVSGWSAAAFRQCVDSKTGKGIILELSSPHGIISIVQRQEQKAAIVEAGGFAILPEEVAVMGEMYDTGIEIGAVIAAMRGGMGCMSGAKLLEWKPWDEATMGKEG